MADERPNLAIIGGSGVYDPSLFDNVKAVKVGTPYGAPSGPIDVGDFMGVRMAFLPRHGKGHTLPPHMVPYRANIWALKSLGVERIISPCAVGSLQMKYRPGTIMLPDQFIDFTKGRRYTFHDGGKTVHVSSADPFCPELRKLIFDAGKRLGAPIFGKGTYITIEGPRFSTRAESRMFREFADIIGMTLNPEIQLAIEQEMCYASIAQITDYDVWAERPVTQEEVFSTLQKNLKRTQELLKAVVPLVPAARGKCRCGESLKNAEV
ncbi:MAG: S-methyl-5'-thioadenosine phosphorylase [Euryarchaeota archaeon]|nr:S-methyl-5'-thioadenosine phosphorylase [Euryarchaeota archaeon]